MVREYQVIGRKAGVEEGKPNPIYRMRIFAANKIIAKSRFWYFLTKLKKIKRAHGEILAVNEIVEKKPKTIKNFGIFLRYNSVHGTHNIYKEFRDVTRCGAVNQLYADMGEGMRVADAVNKCGGVLPTADTNSINMAQVLKDGMEVKIPAKLVTSQNTNGNINKTSEAGGAVVQGNSLVNINQADNKTLETLPGIGPAMAQRIIDFRKENGSFQSVDDLQKVKGIGKAKFAKIKDKVTV